MTAFNNGVASERLLVRMQTHDAIQGSLNYVVESCKHTGRCGKKDKKGKKRKKKSSTNNACVRAPPLPRKHARTHASDYADTAEQTTQSPGDVSSAVCGRQAALSLRTHCPAHRWCFIRESTRPHQTQETFAQSAALTHAHFSS